MNTSLLHDLEYINLVKSVIKSTIETYTKNTGSKDEIGHNLSIDYQTLFEMLKLNVRGQTIAYSSKKAKERNRADLTLEHKIKKLEESLQELTNMHDTTKLYEAKKELDEAKSELIKVREP